jgi:selenocysteine lyase/cysteine desulfurase
VAFEEEFPANYLPWKKLEDRGVQITWLSIHDPLERVDAAARGARLLAISFVNYLSGHRVDLEAIGEVCRRHDCFFFVDAIQGLGAFPLSVRRANIHALSADGHKWLLGPEGCGVLYVRRDVQDQVQPVELGWTNFARYADYAARDLTLRPDAGRYECGTLNTIGIFGLRAAVDFLLDVGVERIAPVVQSLADRIADGVRSRGYEVLASRSAETGAGIVSFRKDGVDARQMVRVLRDRNIIAAPRQGWVRVSPHFYVGTDGVDALLQELG